MTSLKEALEELQFDKVVKFSLEKINIIPDHLREVTETQIRDSDIEYSEIKAKFKETYGALGVSINYYETHTFYYEYDNENGVFLFGTSESIDVSNKGLTM